MAFSDRYRFQIGDRVQNRYTSEEGRVSNLTLLADGSLLVSVAIFITGLFSREESTRVIPGALGGQWQVTARAVGAPVSAAAQALRPVGGAVVSSPAARAAALLDDVVKPTMRGTITQRLAILKHIPVDRGAAGSVATEWASAEAASDALWDYIKDFERKRDAVFKYKGRLDAQLDYLSAPGTVNGQGQWLGGYLADIVHGRRQATQSLLAKGEALERLLAKTKISPELRQAYGSLIPQEVRTGHDLLLHFKSSVASMRYRDTTPLWREYAGVLSEAVRQRPGYQRLQGEAERIPALLEELRHQHRQATENVVGAASWADPRRDNSDFQLKGATSYQVTHDVGKEAASAIREAGYEAGEVDLNWIQRVARQSRLQERNQRAGLTPRAMKPAQKPQQFYKNLNTRVGAVVEYNRVPHVISAIDRRTLKVTLTPVGSDAVLYSKGILNNTEEMAAFTRGLANRGGRASETVSAAARELSKRLATVKTVRVQGGVLGRIKGAVDVPIPLVHAFLTGDVPTTEAGLFRLLTGKEMASAASLPAGTMAAWSPQVTRLRQVQQRYLQGELQRLGITSLHELSDRARHNGFRFHSLIGIPYEEVSQTAKLAEQADILGAVHLQTGVQLSQLRDGMTMGQLSRNVAGRVRRSLVDTLRGRGGPQFEQFSQISKTMKDGEALTGVEAIDRMGAQNIFQAATETPTRQRMLQIELEHRLRVQAAHAGSDPVATFRRVFEDYLPGQAALEPPGIARYAHAADLAGQATRLGGEIRAGVRDVSRLQDLADRLGIELVEGSSSAQQAYRALIKAREKAGGRITPAVQRAARQLALYQNAEFTALDAIRAQGPVSELGQKLGTALTGREPATFAIDAAGRERTARILNPLIEIAETGDFAPLHEAGLQFKVSPRGQIGVLLHGRESLHDPFTYYRTGETAGYASNLKKGAEKVVIPFGMSAVTLDEHEIYDAMIPRRAGGKPAAALILQQEGGAAVTLAQFEARMTQGANRQIEQQVKAQALRSTERGLPFLQTQDGYLLGFAAPDPINLKSVVERTRELARQQSRMIGLDIETDIETGQVLNLTAQHYEIRGGKAVRVGERLDVATPEFFAQGDVGRATSPADLERLREARVTTARQALEQGTVTEATRTITKNGRRVVIDNLVSSERDIVRQAAAYLKQNKETIVGWNIGFDLKELTDSALRLGMTEEFNTLHQAAGNRLADLMFLEQAAHPEAREFGLEASRARLVKARELQAHVASMDVDEAMQLIPAIQRNGAAAEARLATAQQVRLKETQYIWDAEKGRGYQFAGVIDPRKAADLYQAETGELLSQAIGVALQPIDFTTGKADGPLEFRAAKTPHGFGKSFMARHEILENKAALESRLQESAEDLARRRVRRVMEPSNKPFTELLLEQERLALLDAQVKGTLGEAQWGLLQRRMHGETALDRFVAGRTHQWSDAFMGDSRIVRQLQLEQQFFAEEIQGAHGPVVDWLKAHVEAAGEGGLPQARRQANDIWGSYIRETRKLEDFQQIRNVEIPLRERKVTLNILGEKKTVGIGSAEQLERGFQNITQAVARQIDRQRPHELTNLLPTATAQELGALRQRMRAGKSILDNDLGQELTRHIHENYLLPSLRNEGLLEIGKAEGTALSFQAGTLAEAIPQILQQGQQAAQKLIVNKPDNLVPRAFQDRAALEQLQQSFIGESVSDVHRRVSRASNLVFDLQHAAPEPWVGRPAHTVIAEAMQQGEEVQQSFTKSLRSVARNMNSLERQQLQKALPPSWIDTVMHVGAVPAGPAAEAVRAFDPGLGHRLGLQLSEALTENRAALGKLGMGAALLAGGLLAIRALASPGKPPPPADEQPTPNGIASTDAEVERRHQRLLRQQLLTHKVRVNVSAESPQDLDHAEITNAVHEALGGFFGRQIAHQADVSDHRRKITPDYLDRVAHHLFTSGKRPGAPLHG